MKAVQYMTYGVPNVLQLTEIAAPEPRNNEVLIKIFATAVNSADWRLRKADPFMVRFVFGLLKPKNTILGGVLSGEIIQVGKDVKQFKVGDPVFASTGMKLGAYAEYKCLPENAALTIKPDTMSHTDAAAIIFGGSTALHFLQKANIRAGQKVLVYGASGAVGTAAVQLAKYFGATVIGVCSTANVDLIKSLGADKVLDYTTDDFSNCTETYDVVMDTVDKMPLTKGLELLNKNGVLILSAAGISGMIKGLWISITSSRKVVMGVSSETVKGLDFLKERVETSHLKVAIDRIYPLEKIADAHEYVEKGHKKGNVVIDIINQ